MKSWRSLSSVFHGLASVHFILHCNFSDMIESHPFRIKGRPAQKGADDSCLQILSHYPRLQSNEFYALHSVQQVRNVITPGQSNRNLVRKEKKRELAHLDWHSEGGLTERNNAATWGVICDSMHPFTFIKCRREFIYQTEKQGKQPSPVNSTNNQDSRAPVKNLCPYLKCTHGWTSHRLVVLKPAIQCSKWMLLLTFK